MSISPDSDLIDLLSDADFRQWVKTGDFKNPDNYWSDWRTKNIGKEEIVKQAIHILLVAHTDDDITEMEVDQIVTGTWERIHLQENKIKPLWNKWWWAAASIAFIAGGVWFGRNLQFLSKNNRSEIAISAHVQNWMVQTNSTKKPMLLMLPDSSSVVLLSGSILSYPARFEANVREVQLKGEAFFEITKHADQPFFVHTRTITTRVVGTSFNVRAYDHEPDVDVTVKTGKVSVYPTNKNRIIVPENAVLLLPDQHIIYNKTAGKMYPPALQSAPVRLSIGKASFEFIDTPVTAILDSIAHVYGLKVDYIETDLTKCILTTSLTDVPLPGKLKIICKALGQTMQYEVTDTQISIRGKGCD